MHINSFPSFKATTNIFGIFWKPFLELIGVGCMHHYRACSICQLIEPAYRALNSFRKQNMTLQNKKKQYKKPKQTNKHTKNKQTNKSTKKKKTTTTTTTTKQKKKKKKMVILKFIPSSNNSRKSRFPK